METIFGILLYVPGALEAAVFLACLVAFRIRDRRFSWGQPPEALIAASLSLIVLSLALSSGRDFRPLYVLTLIGIAALTSAFPGRTRPLAAIASLSLGIIIFCVAFWQFTFVEKSVVLPSSWEIGARGKPGSGNPEELLVDFRLGPNEHTAVFSDELAAYLKKQGKPEAALTLTLLYQWGRFAGHDLKLVNGKSFKVDGGFGAVGCSEICQRYYFGARGL